MRLFFLGMFFLLGGLAFTTFHVENPYPQDYFRSPVNHPIALSGTFGELRPNHFHAGIDIKSRNGNIGQELYAVAEGFVSRIKVNAGGYGKVLYIDHPNGYTSVYAHLDRFPSPIDKYVQQQQQQRQSFEVDLYPPSEEFLFSKGAIIGWMGLSGRSFGPHLHFEIRDTKTEKPINPLLFGIDIADNIPPKLHQLKVYYLNKNRETIQTKTYDLRKTGKTYRIKNDTLVLGAWRVGFAIKAYDHMNRANNWNGVYAIDMYQNDSLWYNTTMETFAFDETRYINAHLDYEEQINKKSYFNRCYQLPGNGMTSIYKTQTEGGVVELSAHQKKRMAFRVSDTDGNTALLEFWVRRGSVQEPSDDVYNYLLPYDEENIIDNGSIHIYFPKGTLYENLYLQYQSSIDESTDIFSTVHHIHHANVPVHKYFDLSISPNIATDSSKMFIAYCAKDNTITNCGGTWKDNKLYAKVRALGDYCIMKDEIAPTITPKRFNANMRGYGYMSFLIKDDLSTARNVPSINYRATIDGKWILMEYDAKKNRITHHFEETLEKGEHLFRLVVKDFCGNQSVFERTFVR